MSIQNWKPEITGVDGVVKMTLPDEQWIELEPSMARTLGAIFMQRADRAEGKDAAHMLVVPVEGV